MNNNLIHHNEILDMVLISKVLRRFKKGHMWKQLRKAPHGEVLSEECAELPIKELKAILPRPKCISGVHAIEHQVEAQVSSFVGVRHGIPPHVDDGIDGRYSNFVILHNDGFFLNTLPVSSDHQSPNSEGELVSLNIWKPHWLDYQGNPTKPYVWLAFCLPSNKPLETDVFTALAISHLTRYLCPPTSSAMSTDAE